MFLSQKLGIRQRVADLGKASGFTAGRFFAWTTGLVLLSPIVFVLWGFASQQKGESWSHIESYLLPEAFQNTLILALAVACLTLLLGVTPAWLVSRFRFPGRRLFAIALVLPLAIPPYIAAYITTDLREATIPWLVDIRRTKGVESYLQIEKILRYSWLILILSLTLSPYLYLTCRAVFASNARRLAEASRLLGASPWRAFRTIHLPLIRPALVAGLFLISMEVVSDYGAAKHFGVSTLTVVIFRTWFALDELASARYLAGLVLLGIFALLALERSQRRRARFATNQAAPSALQQSSFLQILLCWVGCGIPVLLGFLYPSYKLSQWHFANSSAAPWLSYWDEIKQTLTLGLGATATCLIASLFLLAMARLGQRRPEKLLASLTGTAGYATPGTVMAVGVLGIASWSRSALSPLGSWVEDLLVSGSFLWLIFALTARYLTVSSQVLASGYATIPQRFDHSARLLGRSARSVFASIHLPLLRAPLLSAAVLVFIDISKELPLTLLLRPFNFETLGTTSYSYANQGQIFACSTPALLLILLSTSCLLVVELLGWKKTRHQN